MEQIDRLIKIFSDFPGIGPRQARRFVYYLLAKNEVFLNDLNKQIVDLKKSVRLCQKCFRHFTREAENSSACSICRNPNRDAGILMIVTRDVDLENIEKSHSFNGHYFVLGNTVPILDKNPEQKIRLAELINLVEKNKYSEIILGLNANAEGEYTGIFITQALNPLITTQQIKISQLGRGLSTGTELEYSDSDTIKNALKNRG